MDREPLPHAAGDRQLQALDSRLAVIESSLSAHAMALEMLPKLEARIEQRRISSAEHALVLRG